MKKLVVPRTSRNTAAKGGWSQLILSEKLDISANFLSGIEIGKGWVSPLTLVKLAIALELEVFDLFKPLAGNNNAPNGPETEKMRRFARDLSLALDASTAEVAKILQNTVMKVCKKYLGWGKVVASIIHSSNTPIIGQPVV